MAIHNWWEGDPAEHYWMEITNRSDLGVDLKAPQTDPGGRESWSYTLVTYVRPGDRVLHWHASLVGEPAIVGWSEAAGPLGEVTLTWQARGTRGRARGGPNTGPAWRLPLRNYVELDQPITRSMLNEKRSMILSTLSELGETVGRPIYAPFQDYGHRELRAQQAYLVKFPAALVDLLFEKSTVTAETASPGPSARRGTGSHSQGFQSDAAVRTALESRAVEVAIEHYRRSGAAEISVLGRPFDLLVVIGGRERHVEVKGSVGVDVQAIQLTQGEVDHARRWSPTDLFVVDSIDISKDENGIVRASGGRPRVWEEWTPDARALRPTQLRYELPAHAQRSTGLG